MSQEFNENPNVESEATADSDFAYKSVIGSKRNTRLWSIISFVLAILSIPFCAVPIAGIIMGLGAIAFSLYSKKCLGYFDGLSLAGLMIGIFGAVFSVAALILKNIILAFFATLFA